MIVDCKYLNVNGDCILKGKDKTEVCEGECAKMVAGWTREDEADQRQHEEMENGL